MRVLIVGCGYVGTSLGAELVRQGHEVTGLRRTRATDEALTASGIRPLCADITRPADLAALPRGYDWVVCCASSTQGGTEDYRRVYVDGLRNLIDWLAETPPRRFVYTSSTGVYGQDNGAAVKEDSPTEPATDTGQVLVEAERQLLQAIQQRQFPAVILRVAGIYGPDRGHFFKLFLNGQAQIEGNGTRHLNMIHREDVGGVILTALKARHAGAIYNAVDDEPVTQLHFYRWLSETLGKPMPPHGPDPDPAARKRGVTDKRVQNRRLKMELGYQFRFPTFRQGYTEEIQRLEQLGVIEPPPEPGGRNPR